MGLPDANARVYDNTRISCWKTCPRMYLIRHILGWRTEGTGVALVFGGAWHAGQDTIWEFAKEVGAEQLAAMAYDSFLKKWEEEGLDPIPSMEQVERYGFRTPGVAHEMYEEYVLARWNMLQESEILGIEQPFAVPIPGMTDVWYIGKLDKAVNFNNQDIIIEHKTTAMYATQGNFRSDYIDSWYMDSQVKGYQFGGGLFYPGLSGVWIDNALVHKKIHNAFKFVPVSHSFSLLSEWLSDTKRWVETIIQEEDALKVKGFEPGMFRKNENSCFGKYGACPYIDICRTTSDPTALEGPPPGFMYEPWIPFDVIMLGKVITD